MHKTELIKKVAELTGQTDRDTEKTIDTTLDLITKTIKAGEEVMLTGFGAFSAKTRHARNGVNPLNPSQKIQIPEVRVAKFKAGKALKDALKGKSAAVKPEEVNPEKVDAEESTSQPEESAPMEQSSVEESGSIKEESAE